MKKQSQPDRKQELKVKIKALQCLYGITNRQAGILLRISERSFARRLQNPENLKVKDLLKLEQVLHTELLNVGGIK